MRLREGNKRWFACLRGGLLDFVAMHFELSFPWLSPTIGEAFLRCLPHSQPVSGGWLFSEEHESPRNLKRTGKGADRPVVIEGSRGRRADGGGGP